MEFAPGRGSGFEYLQLQVQRIPAGETLEGSTDANEMAIVVWVEHSIWNQPEENGARLGLVRTCSAECHRRSTFPSDQLYG